MKSCVQKNQISLLILPCVDDRFVMCWAFSLWEEEIKFDLHPNLWVCYHKQQHVPHVRIPPAGYNWIKLNQLKKLLKIKTIVTADKINNYFCLEVTYSCGNLLQHYSNKFSLWTISIIRISRKKLSLSQQNYMKT